MIKLLKNLIPRPAINYGKHLPSAVLANLRYGLPAKEMIVVGVTGTDGKTTTVNMIYQILKQAGKNVSMLSTINAVIAGQSYDTGFHVTSPSPSQLYKYIKLAKEANSKYLVLEVTSHSIDQFRIWGLKFDIAVITNVTHEHLDYHKTFENYLKVKSRLIKNSKIAVLNKDDKNFSRLSQIAKGKVVSFGLSENAEFNPSDFDIKLKLPGEFNLLNGLAASAVAINLGIEPKTIKEALENLATLEGRMEKIDNNLGINIVIDFAHTPAALEQALKTLKNKGKLIAVFGAASQRDTQKRPLMGKIAADLADIIILTDEDPRFEDSLKIIDEIAVGAVEMGVTVNSNLFKQPNRREAIDLAIKMAKKGDTVVILGKGHEKSMNYRGIEQPWSDKQQVLDILNKL